MEAKSAAAENDGVHRWMASTAMDGDGNIAIGYNTSGVDDGSGNALSTFAGMRYAGRLKDDPRMFELFSLGCKKPDLLSTVGSG